MMSRNPFANDVSSYRVDLATRAMEIDACPAGLMRVAELHVRFGEGLLLVGTQRFADRYPDVPQLSESDLVVVTKLEHELDHFRRITSTSFGQLIGALFNDEVEHASKLVDWNLGGELKKPGADTVPTVAQATAASDAMLFLVADCLVENGYPSSRLDNALSAFQRVGGSTTFDLGPKPYSNLLPVVKIRGRNTVLGTQALLEYLAVSMEASYAAFGIGKNAVPVEQLQKVAIYNLVGKIWRDVYGLPMPHVTAKLWKTDETLPGARFPVELTAAIDLALWIPFTPSGWKEGFTWQDMHPAHRFLSILDELKRPGRVFTPYETGTSLSDAHFEHLQNELASRFGWPTPRSLAEEWLGALEAVQRARNATPWSIDADHVRWRCDADYLRTKLRHPGLSVTSRPTSAGYPHLWFGLLAAENEVDETTELFVPAFGNEATFDGYHFPIAYSLRHVSQAIIHAMSASASSPMPHVTRRALKGREVLMWRDFREYHRRRRGGLSS